MLEIIIYNNELSLKFKKNSILLHKPRSYMFESHENNLQPEMHIINIIIRSLVAHSLGLVHVHMVMFPSYLTNREVLTVLCSAVKHAGSG